jgi:ribose 5-phosphate isomerase B
MILALAADHAGFDLKKVLLERLEGDGHRVLDLGTCSHDPVDYPDFALAAGLTVREGLAERAVIVCGSGVGAAVAANKMPGIRAGLCHDSFSARQAVEDDDVNILCLGSRVVGRELAWEVVKTFLAARFSGAERHRRRLAKIAAMERRFACPSDPASEREG